MPIFYVKNKEGKWNIFSTVVDDFRYDNFMEFDKLKKLVLMDLVSTKQRELDTLLTDKPELNVMDYKEAMKSRRK